MSGPEDRGNRDSIREHLSSTATYPLFQGMADGKKEWRTLDVEDASRLAGLARTEFLSEDIVVETDSMAVFLLRIETFGDDGASRGRYQLLYCVAREGDEWKLAWRQWVATL